jgi:hypothetical protein
METNNHKPFYLDIRFDDLINKLTKEVGKDERIKKDLGTFCILRGFYRFSLDDHTLPRLIGPFECMKGTDYRTMPKYWILVKIWGCSGRTYCFDVEILLPDLFGCIEK